MRFRKQPSHEDVPEYLNAGVALLGAATAEGGGYALTYIDSVGVIERATFAEVGHRARQWSHLLSGSGLEPGDRVVLLAGRDREWRSAMLGVLQAGGVVVPCGASTPLAELSAVAEHVSGKRIFFASAEARPDLEDAVRGQVLSTRDLDPRGAAKAAPPPHRSRERDVALIFCTRRADGLQSAMHTHAALLAEADAGESWLGARWRRRLWTTVDDGSPASVWVTLAAWRAGSELIEVEQAFAPREQIELLARLQPAAVWFTDDVYAELASEGEAAAFAAGSIGRVLTDGTGVGAPAFAGLVGAQVASVPELDETGARVIGTPDVEPAALTEPESPVAPDGSEEAEHDRWLAAEHALGEKERREEDEQSLADEALAREQAEQRRAGEEQRLEEERRQEAERSRREEEEQQQARARREEEEEHQRQAQAEREAEEQPQAQATAMEEPPPEEPPPPAAQTSLGDELAPSILSQITAYGGASPAEEPGKRRDTA